MTAQQHETVWTFFLVAGTATAGQVMCFNGTRTGVLVATSANRTAAGRGACGVALTSGDATEPAIEVQVVGPLDPAIANVGVGPANESVRVSTSGTLERVASPTGADQVVGTCDADGAVYLNFFGGSGTGGGGSAAHVAGNPGDIQTRAAVGGDLDYLRNWTSAPDPANGQLICSFQNGPPSLGVVKIISTSETLAAASLPAFGWGRVSDLNADNGGFNSITLFSYYTSKYGGVGRAALGISGGDVFLGDPSNPTGNTQINGATMTVLTGAGSTTSGVYTSKTAWTDFASKTGLAAWKSDGTLQSVLLGSAYQIPRVNSAGTAIEFAEGASATISALAIDWNVANVFTKTLSAGGNTFTFSNANSGQSIVVILTGAASTVTWPTVKWAGGVAPTQTASGTDVYTFVKAGTTIYGSVVQNLS